MPNSISKYDLFLVLKIKLNYKFTREYNAYCKERNLFCVCQFYANYKFDFSANLNVTLRRDCNILFILWTKNSAH